MLTYTSAIEQLKHRDTKKLANNTYLVNNHDGTISLRMKWPDARQLPETDILVLKPESVQLFTGGYRTYSTKERLNAYSPVCVGQSKNIWYVSKNWQDSTTSLYYDGIEFAYDGTQLSPIQSDDTKALKQARAMKKRINAYADLCVEQVQQGIALPGNGDCFHCSMHTTNGIALGDAVHDTEHLLEHMTEEYVVPSLIYNAMKEKGYSEKQFIMFCGYDTSGSSGKHQIDFMLKRVRKCIYDYLVKRLVTNAV